LLGATALNGLLLALFGIIQRLGGAQEMFWFYVPQSSSGDQTFFGSFVYAGHAAAWMVLAFGAAAAMMDRHLRQRDPLAPPAAWGWPAMTAWIWVAPLVVVVVALAVFVKPYFWLLAAGGVMGLYTWLWLRRWWLAGQKRRATLYALPALVFMAVLLGATTGAAWWWHQGGSGSALEVNPHDASLPVRYAIARTSAVMIKDEPLWGWGPGSFRYVAPFYLRHNPLFADPNKPGDIRYTASFAHSDWVQIPAEWGLAGAALFAALPLWWVGQAWRLRRVLPGESRIMLGTVALIFAGATADFPFYNLAVLIAVGVLTATAVKLGEIAARPRPLLSKVMVVCP
jgi:O-antigen ligase